MRYYAVSISRPDGTPYFFKSLGNQQFATGVVPGVTTATVTSLLPTGSQSPQQGLTNPAALNVEIDIATYAANAPDVDNARLRIWGLGLQDIGAATSLKGMNIAVSAGMAKGLPLANPSQAGLICSGMILYSVGNWNGTNQYVDIFISPGGSATSSATYGVGSTDTPRNFSFSWPAGTSLATAIQNTLKAALPGLAPVVSISPNLVLNHAEAGHYESLGQFASAINEISYGIIGGSYPGITISINGSTISVSDGTVPPSQVKAIQFQDLIGQPSWVDSATISVACVMRADINVNDTISLPQTIVGQTQQAGLYLSTRPSNSLTFSGQFRVTNCHHWGNYRQPDASSWVTVYQCILP